MDKTMYKDADLDSYEREDLINQSKVDELEKISVRLYALYDSVAESFGAVQEADNDEVARRMFLSTLRGVVFPDQMTLYFLGYKEKKTGAIHSLGSKVIAEGAELLESIGKLEEDDLKREIVSMKERINVLETSMHSMRNTFFSLSKKNKRRK